MSRDRQKYRDMSTRRLLARSVGGYVAFMITYLAADIALRHILFPELFDLAYWYGQMNTVLLAVVMLAATWRWGAFSGFELGRRLGGGKRGDGPHPTDFEERS